MRKLLTLGLLLLAIAVSAQIHKNGQHHKRYQPPIIILNSEQCVYDLGGTFTKPEARAVKICLYTDRVEMHYRDRILPRVIQLQDLQLNSGECEELGKYVIYQWYQTRKSFCRVSCYYSVPDGYYVFSVEHPRYTELWRIL